MQGITFGDFKEFCQFLNNLDDFALAMRIYTYASQPISESEHLTLVVVVCVVVVMLLLLSVYKKADHPRILKSDMLFCSVVFVNENENEFGVKRENNKFVIKKLKRKNDKTKTKNNWKTKTKK